PAIPPPAPERPIRLPEIPPPARVPAAPVMPEGPHVDPHAPTIRPPAPGVDPHAPTIPAPGREEPSAPRPGARAWTEGDVRAVHPVREGTASAVRGSELFRGDTHVGMPGNETRVAERVGDFRKTEAGRFNFAADPTNPEHGLI